MGIWERLETVIKSYITPEKSTSGRTSYSRHRDPDLDAAFEELDDFLGGNGKEKTGQQEDASASQSGSASFEKTGAEKKHRSHRIPEELKADFAELGLSADATLEECKEAYKKLLKIHHPDRHTKHERNMKKATEKSARVNASYERIIAWFRASGV